MRGLNGRLQEKPSAMHSARQDESSLGDDSLYEARQDIYMLVLHESATPEERRNEQRGPVMIY